jgi:hypothetical protein
MLTLRPAGLGQDDDFVVLDGARREIGRIMWTHAASSETPWFWTITARGPQGTLDRGNARRSNGAVQSTVDAMTDIKANRQSASGLRRCKQCSTTTSKADASLPTR